MKSITIKSPASVANLVCGFDIIGLALEEPYDIMHLEFKDDPGLTIEHIDYYGLPVEVEKNVAGVALASLMKEIEPEIGFKLSIDKKNYAWEWIGVKCCKCSRCCICSK